MVTFGGWGDIFCLWPMVIQTPSVIYIQKEIVVVLIIYFGYVPVKYMLI